MRRLAFLVVSSIVTLQVFAQQLPLINSGALIERASVLQDSGQYEVAIKNLLTVPKRDTNYLWVQVRLAELYNHNKQYDEAIAVADRVLKKPERFRASTIRAKANALESQKAYDQAITLLQSALKDYPFDVQLRYQLATSYHNKLDYANAVKAYYDVLEISPFSSNTHLNLGGIAMWTGHKTQAMLSYGVYLALSSTDNSKLSLLENLCSNQAENEGAAKQRGGANGFEKLDQIIRSKIAMDKKFKTEVPIDAATVKQFEMLVKQLNTVSPDVQDPWVKFYVPVYESLRDKKAMEAFLYHILSSSSIEAVKKWNSKNEKARNAFFEVINTALARDRADVRAPAALGLGATTRAEYNEDNLVSGVGAFSNGKENGKWIYYFNNSEKSAEGEYDDGAKKGVWNYYAKNGILSSTENEDTGEITKWYPEGGKEYHYFLKNENIEGEITFYHPCGSVSERRTYKEGKKWGKGQMFHPNGVVSSDFEYADGKLSGAWIDYDVFGKVKGKSTYKDGIRHGLTETFWSNSKPKEREPSSEGKLDGAAEGYHANGTLWYKGNYANGEPVGEWMYYNRYGEHIERRFYAADGSLDQENKFYYRGRLESTLVYKKGGLTAITYFDESGKELWKGGSPDGNFDGKHFFAIGSILSEGRFKNGKREGKWTQYYSNGLVESVYNYAEGKYDGELVDYFQNGKKKIVSQFKDGNREGYYQEFSNRGNIAKQGWYSNGEAQQQWLIYFPDGSVKEDLYYLNNQLVDSAFIYSVEGEITSRHFYKAGELLSNSTSDPMRITYIKDARKTETYDLKYASGSRQVKYDVKCGMLHGPFERLYPDGKTAGKFDYVADLLQGPYKGYDEFGRPVASGMYSAGEISGLWSFYNETGNLDHHTRYVNGEIDSTVVTYYDFGALYSFAEYRYGKRNGVVKVFAPNGIPIFEKRYDDDQLWAIRSIDKTGHLGEWTPAKPSMKIEIYYPNGTKGYQETFEKGALSGMRWIWFPDGKPCMEVSYVDGNLEGPSVDYFPNGKILKKTNFHLGELDGTVEVFQENGMPLMTTNYKLGEKSGTTILYSKGVKTKEIVYYNGMPMK